MSAVRLVVERRSCTHLRPCGGEWWLRLTVWRWQVEVRVAGAPACLARHEPKTWPGWAGASEGER